MKTIPKCLRLFLAMVVATSSVVAAQAKDQELVYVVNDEAQRYDPGLTTETFAAAIIANTFEGLVKLDKMGKIVPGAAEKWTISDDGLVYTFTLRDNLKWSDGKPLTANDFAWAWKRVLAKETAARNAPMLYYIKNAQEHSEGKVAAKELGIQVPDKRTIVMTINTPTPYMLQLMTYAVYLPVREDVVAKDPEGWSRRPELHVGNGPFRISEINIGKSIVLIKNPHYQRAKEIKLDKLTFRLIPDVSTSLAAMEAGEVDGIREVPPAEIPRLQVESQAFYVIPALGTTYALFNCQRKPLDDVRVRKALAKAIDRTALIEDVLQGADEPAMAVVPFGMGLGGKDFREEGGFYGLAPEAQLDEAKALLAAAGYPDGRDFPKLTYKYYTHPRIKKLVEAISQMWKKNLGIDMDIATLPWKVYYPEIRNLNFDISQMGWDAKYSHPMTFLDNFLSHTPNNLTNWKSELYDQAINAAKATRDLHESIRQMHQAEDILMNDHVLLTIFHRSYHMMMAQHVKGWWRSPFTGTYFEDAYLEK